MKNIMTVIWIFFIGTLLYIYIFHPETFEHMFTYSGPGSPFVNTPYQN